MNFHELRKKKQIAILWWGLEWQSTYRFLRAHGIPNEHITILDKNETIYPPEWVASVTWPLYLEWLDLFDCIWRAPGITKTIIETSTWKTTDGLPFISQTEFFLHNYKGKIIWITGTKGKSTISMLTYLTLLHAEKKVILAGNVGKPIFDQISRNDLPDIVVYEFSSFMIESVFSNRTGRKIDIAVLNTLYSTHTKEHWWYEPYVRAKLLLCDHAEQSCIGYQAKTILENDFPDYEIPHNSYIYWKEWTYTRSDGYFFKNNEKLFTDSWMLLIWEHNRENACAVIALCELLKVDLIHLQETLKTFKWLEHRLELVWTYHNIIRYNDAIATTPQATCAALDSFWQEVDTLFYGWVIGEYDHTLVVKKIKEYGIRNLVLFPDTGEILYSLLDEKTKSTISVLHTRSMSEAVARAAWKTEPWKIALLSCGSPSFSVWSGFVEKWNLFKESIKKIQQ